MADSSRKSSRPQYGNNKNGGGYKKRDERGSSFSRDRNGEGRGGERRFNDRPRGERKFGERDDRRSDSRGERKFGDRNDRRNDSRGDRKFSDRGDNRGERSYGRDRNGEGRGGDRKFGDRNDRRNDSRGERKFSDRPRGERRDDRSYNDRNSGGRRYNNENRPDGGHTRGGQAQREARNFSQENTKAGYRPSKGQGPEFDTDVTGKELDRMVQRQLQALEIQNAEVVAMHLVMAGRYLDIDPAFALEHAKAATKRAGRIGAVREAAGIAAYVAEDFELALRELRTHRRISGSNEHLAVLIDTERALGRIDKALEMAEESKQEEELPAAVRVEIALVVSGIRHDQGDLKGAIAALEIPELNAKRGFEYSPRLFETYADLLDEDGRAKEAARWMRLAVITEAALGQGDYAEPEIFDIFDEEEPLEEEPSIDLENAAEKVDTAVDEAVKAGAVKIEEDEDEIKAETTVDDDIELEADVQEALVYTPENAQEDLLSIIEENEQAEQKDI